MNDAAKHATTENMDLFTSNGMAVGTNFVETVEKHNLCPVCFLNYLHTFLADAILTELPEKRDEILGSMLDLASVLLGEEVVFMVIDKVQPQEPTTAMNKVVDAFIEEMSTKPEGKLN